MDLRDTVSRLTDAQRRLRDVRDDLERVADDLGSSVPAEMRAELTRTQDHVHRSGLLLVAMVEGLQAMVG